MSNTFENYAQNRRLLNRIKSIDRGLLAFLRRDSKRYSRQDIVTAMDSEGFEISQLPSDLSQLGIFYLANPLNSEYIDWIGADKEILERAGFLNPTLPFLQVLYRKIPPQFQFVSSESFERYSLCEILDEIETSSSLKPIFPKPVQSRA